MACQSPHYDYRFHHTHVFVDSIKPLAEYKQLEAALNALAKKGSFDPMSGQVEFLVPDALQERIAEARAHWTKLMPGAKDPKVYKSQSQDFVTQLIAGTGWRVTAEHVGEGTRSLLVCSEDPCGAKMVVTAKTRDVADEPYNHFNSSTVQRFHDMHAGRQGIAVLGFECAPGKIDEVFANYQKLHPKLLASELNVHKDTRVVNNGSKQRTIELGSFKAMEVFAYYLPNNSEDADKGTLIRFVERTGSYSGTPGFGNPHGVLPGLVNVPAEFDGTSCSSYSDHWVSNVDDRNRFLNTLKDTLGFMPKVDFNAGVVAAGEAIIESTVTGNTSELNTQDLQVAFEDQSQVYLPINNALSPVGHVAGYIKEIGQGVQHLAQRVKNLSQFIERVSNYREITGEGFTFLRIPRSYYGRLTTQTLVKKGGVSEGLAKAVFDALVAAGNLTLVGIIDMDIQPAQVEALVLPAEHQAEFKEKVAVISMLVLRSRYENIFALLRDLISDEEYVRIVRHQVLVDIQVCCDAHPTTPSHTTPTGQRHPLPNLHLEHPAAQRWRGVAVPGVHPACVRVEHGQEDPCRLRRLRHP